MREDYERNVAECSCEWLDGSERLRQLEQYAREIRNENSTQQL